MMKFSQVILALALAGVFSPAITGAAQEVGIVSVVDFLNALGQESDFDSRRELYASISPSEQYKGTAQQNTDLLHQLFKKQKLLGIPIPSSNIDGCDAFYNNKSVSQAMTEAFADNAIKACIVTGTDVAPSKIRKELQRLYSETKPANSSHFTANEHKAIHDQAYKAAGCTEDSADIVLWYAVNYARWPEEAIKLGIDLFGKCSASSD